MATLLILAALIAFIVLATSRWNFHPFIALLLAALAAGLAYGVPLADLPKMIGDGFGAIMAQIGLVIVLGTVIGVILERTGAAIAMAQAVIGLIGTRFPALTISLIGFIVSIPVFSDSAYVILNSLKNAMARQTSSSPVAMTIALATGLFATHIFVPPTPGPIAAAGNLGLANLGLLIALGLVVALAAAMAGLWWATRFADSDGGDGGDDPAADLPGEDRRDGAPTPSATRAFAPIVVPIALICLGSVANLPGAPLGDGDAAAVLRFIGHPLVALAVGLAAACALLPARNRLAALNDHLAEGLAAAAPILLVTGAGGAFGAVLKSTALGPFLAELVLGYQLGLFAPFLIAAGFKCAQGSSTVAMVATSALMAPLLGPLGYDSDVELVLMVLAIGSGAMMVSHANDSFFWVVAQFGRLPPAVAFRRLTTATFVQGVAGLAMVHLLALLLL